MHLQYTLYRQRSPIRTKGLFILLYASELGRNVKGLSLSRVYAQATESALSGPGLREIHRLYEVSLSWLNSGVPRA